MPSRTVVEIMNQLLADWATPRIPEYMQGIRTGVDMPMQCSATEATTPVVAKHLPEDLESFWSKFFDAKLFEDVNYGQWGLRLLEYETSNQRTRQFNRDRPQDAARGDRVIGEFIGDLEQLVIRCDSSDVNFGHILVALPASPRDEWYRVEERLSSFLDKEAILEGVDSILTYM